MTDKDHQMASIVAEQDLSKFANKILSICNIWRIKDAIRISTTKQFAGRMCIVTVTVTAPKEENDT